MTNCVATVVDVMGTVDVMVVVENITNTDVTASVSTVVETEVSGMVNALVTIATSVFESVSVVKPVKTVVDVRRWSMFLQLP